MTAVGFVFDPVYLEHAMEDHPERPERLTAIVELLEECGLMSRLEPIEARGADDGELAFVHDPRYVAALRQACASGGGWADPDTYIVGRSCEAAWRAAGGCIAATEAVLEGRVKSVFCAVRPPGHHARPSQAMGFCLLNSIAVAAQYARQRHGVERVAIVDIDVHHGNGTQDAFYDDASVLYVSTHQYPFYPGTGRPEETGADGARGTNVNIALPGGCGDNEYRSAFEQVVEPVVDRFQPQFMLVSLGFDAHFADPLAGMSLSVDGYGELAARLKALAERWCDGRIVFVLEGGYDLTAVAWGARRVIEVLLGEPPTPDPLGPAPPSRPRDIDALLREVRELVGLE